MIDIHQLVTKPTLEITAEELLLAYTNRANKDVTTQISAEELTSDVQRELELRVSELNEIINQIQPSAEAISSIPLSAAKQEFLGIREITLSNYLKSLGGGDPKSIILTEDYEAASFSRAEFSGIMYGDVLWTRTVLQEAIDDTLGLLASTPNNTNIPTKISTECANHARSFSQQVRSHLSEFRDVLLDEFNRENVVESLLGPTALIDSTKIPETINHLRVLRSVLIASSSITKTKWKERRGVLSQLRNNIIRNQRRRLFIQVGELEQKVLSPAFHALAEFGVDGPIQRAVIRYIQPLVRRVITSVNERILYSGQCSAIASQSLTLMSEAVEVKQAISTIDEIIRYLQGYSLSGNTTTDWVKAHK